MHKEYRLLVMNRIVLVLFLIIFLSSFGWCYANDSADSKVISVVSAPYNNTYGEWTAKWWQWIISIDKTHNPGNDETGRDCGYGQDGPIWFLTGTFENLQRAERNCTIPKEKAIFIPVVNSEKSYTEFPELKDEAALRLRAKNAIDRVTKKIITIDGKEIKDLQNYCIQSPLFEITFPENNIYGVQPGPSQAVSDGYWILLQPFKELKEHVIEFGGEAWCQKDKLEFTTNVKYNITLV